MSFRFRQQDMKGLPIIGKKNNTSSKSVSVFRFCHYKKQQKQANKQTNKTDQETK